MSRELPEVLEKKFVICDNSVNRKKWRLLVQGIQLDGFLKNPVCCVEHEMWRAAIGKWKDVHVEGEQLKGTLEFDRHDPEAVKLFWKYEDGFMSAVSLHIMPLEESEVPEMLLPGQIYPTITKSELLEVSVVTVPGQKNAVKLSNDLGGEYQLNLIVNKIDNMNEPKNEKDAKIEALEAKLSASEKKNAEMLIQMHVQRGAVQEGEKESLMKLAMSDFATVETMLSARTVEDSKKVEEPKKDDDEAKRLATAIDKLNAGEAPKADERENWDFYQWKKKDGEGLAMMAKNDPERYKKLELAFLQAQGVEIE